MRPAPSQAYRDALARTGRDTALGTGRSTGCHFYMAKIQEQGIQEAVGYFEENLKSFGPLRLVRSLTDQQIADMTDPQRPRPQGRQLSREQSRAEESWGGPLAPIPRHQEHWRGGQSAWCLGGRGDIGRWVSFLTPKQMQRRCQNLTGTFKNHFYKRYQLVVYT